MNDQSFKICKIYTLVFRDLYENSYQYLYSRKSLHRAFFFKEMARVCLMLDGAKESEAATFIFFYRSGLFVEELKKKTQIFTSPSSHAMLTSRTCYHPRLQ
jgi:hypothetical protein